MIEQLSRKWLGIFVLVGLTAFLLNTNPMARAQRPTGPIPTDESVPLGLKRLVAAYPADLCSASANQLHWCDGTRMDYDDGLEKDFEQKMNSGDLEDQLSLTYPKSFSPPLPVNFDPGRIRHEAFFLKMYGRSARAVRSRLKTVAWLPGFTQKKIQVTSVNGIDEKMKLISQEISRLDRSIVKKVQKASGTFVWRRIKDTNRLSVHSFGAAIDVGIGYSDYWKWTRPGPDGLFRFTNRFPLEVVEIFERYGFIWGGKWYHFDTMHFEYRPELLPEYARVQPTR